MDIKMMHIKRKAKCALAPINCQREPIQAGDRIIRGVAWSMNKAGQKLRIQRTWHIECWLAKCHWWLDRNPYQPQTGGGPKPIRLHLTPEQKKQRRALTARVYYLRKRKLEYVELHLFWRVSEMNHKLRKLRKDYETCGGVPSHWRE